MRSESVNVDAARLRFFEAAEEGQQGSFAYTILSQEAVDPALLKGHVDVIQDLSLRITECKIVNLYHVGVLVY